MGLCEVSQKRVALALYSRASALNHSCAPTAAFRHSVNMARLFSVTGHDVYGIEALYRSCRVEVVATASVPAGEEVCVSYGPTAAQGVLSRRQLLQKAYGFTCTCRLCSLQLLDSSDTDTDHGSGSGGSGGNEIVGNDDRKDDDVTVINDGDGLLTSIDEELRRLASRLQTSLIRESSGASPGVKIKELSDIHSRLQAVGNTLQTCRQSSEMKVTKFHAAIGRVSELQSDWAQTMCFVLDQLGEKAARGGNHRQAISYVEQAIALMTNNQANPLAVSDDDVTVARERVKVVELLSACGDMRAVYDMAVKVREDLRPYVDVYRDPDFLEMVELIHYVEVKDKKQQPKNDCA
jgi:hypothetical protein